MCGIAGILVPNDQETSLRDVTKMGESLHHRGPDNLGVFVQNNSGFAHTRLSIIDLSDAGNQPFRNARYTLCFNGEIYNYLELRAQLAREQVEFASTSDTEVLFYALIHYGIEKTLNAIQGMFAFSFFDHETKQLSLCRDRYGIKPLYWLYRSGKLYWGSEVKAIAAVTTIEPDPVQALWSIASTAEISSSHTIFKDVHPVAPGEYLSVQPGQPPQAHRYYDVIDQIDETYFRELDRLSPPEVSERFSQFMRESIKGMLMSDAPMGAFVSGGVDSSLIAGIAVRSNPNLALFSSNVIGKHSEIEDARLLCQSIHAALHEADFTPEMMLTHWAKTTYHYEVPIIRHTNAIPFATVAALARTCGVKAVLTGEGADELFLGYPKLSTRLYDGLIRLPITAVQKAYGIAPPLYNYIFPADSSSSPHFLALTVQNFEAQRLSAFGAKRFGFLNAKARDMQVMTVGMLREGLVSLLHRNDRVGMMSSIEARFPFLDERLVRFAINLPYRFKIARTLRFHNYKHAFLLDKAVVRNAARAYLPEKLVNKRKEGFPMYGHKNIRVQPEFFENGYVQQIAGLSNNGLRYMVESSGQDYLIAKFASLEIFGKLFVEQQTPDEVSELILRHIRLKIA